MRPHPIYASLATLGLAALLWSRHPDWPAGRVRAALRQSAHDLGPPGPDGETGYGLLHLPAD